MPKRLEWNKISTKTYETGVDMGVLYRRDQDGVYNKGIAWNGLTTISEKPSGADDNPFYADNQKWLSIRSAEEFGCTIEAYTYPEEFGQCDGTAELSKGVIAGQQNRETFGLSYRNVLGNDTKGNDYGYKLHLVYGCQASPSDRQFQTINNSPDIISFSWDISTVPVSAKGLKPTSILTIDSTKIEKEKLKKLEDVLYGSDQADARLPLHDEVKTILES